MSTGDDIPIREIENDIMRASKLFDSRIKRTIDELSSDFGFDNTDVRMYFVYNEEKERELREKCSDILDHIMDIMSTAQISALELWDGYGEDIEDPDSDEEKFEMEMHKKYGSFAITLLHPNILIETRIRTFHSFSGKQLENGVLLQELTDNVRLQLVKVCMDLGLTIPDSLKFFVNRFKADLDAAVSGLQGLVDDAVPIIYGDTIDDLVESGVDERVAVRRASVSVENIKNRNMDDEEKSKLSKEVNYVANNIEELTDYIFCPDQLVKLLSQLKS